MLIALTTSYDPGSAAGDGPYTHAGITNVSWQPESNRIDLAVGYGTNAAGDLVPGAAATKERATIHDQGGTAYADFLAATTSDGVEKCPAAMERALLIWVKDNIAALAGTIVTS